MVLPFILSPEPVACGKELPVCLPLIDVKATSSFVSEGNVNLASPLIVLNTISPDDGGLVQFSEISPLTPVPDPDPRAPASQFEYADGGGRVGFIASVSKPFCLNCNRIRLTADGKLRYCLFAIEEDDVKALLRSGATDDDIAALVPDARATTIFALVNALGRRDRARALEILDTLTREGEYLPLALAFLSTQFRMALVAREANLKSAQQIQGHFTRLGIPMWGSRGEQVQQTVAKFSQPQLERAIKLTFEADRGMRDTRPDDRIVMERFILALAAN